MKNKLSNFLMLSVIALGGIVVSHSAAMAQRVTNEVTSPDVEFEGTVSNMCAFGNPVSGSFADTSDPSQDYILAASEFGEGVSASINLACNGDAELAVSDMQEVSKPAGMTSDYVVAIAGTSSTWFVAARDSIGQSFSDVLEGPFNEDVSVFMFVVYDTPVKPGQYKYTTKLTATPQ